MHCVYYQAYVQRKDCWFVVAILRSFEHMAFDRTLDPQLSLFEFFVPRAMEQQFLLVMNRFLKSHVISDLKKHTNRLCQDKITMEQ